VNGYICKLDLTLSTYQSNLQYKDRN